MTEDNNFKDSVVFKSLQNMTNRECSNDIEIKTEKCIDHGEYESKNIFGDYWSKCPECSDIKIKKRDREEIEKIQKEEKLKTINNILNNSLVPERFKECTLENYKTENQGQKEALKLTKDYFNNFKKINKTGSSMFYCGTYGTGKTHLAISVLLKLIKSGRIRGIYITTMRMLRDIRRSYSNHDLSEQVLIDKYIEIPLLVLDEVGVQMGTDAEKLLIYEVVNGRYENYRPTILISNLSFKDMKTYLGERSIDRLKSKHGSMIIMDWESYRSKI